jgi:hypothetical protein
MRLPCRADVSALDPGRKELTLCSGAARMCCWMIRVDQLAGARAGPACAGGPSKAEPALTPGRGGAQRSRLDQIRLNSATQRSVWCAVSGADDVHSDWSDCLMLGRGRR